MSMALHRWWRIREGASGGADPAERAQSRDSRHELANVQHQIAMQTQVIKNAADAIEAHIEYLRATAKDRHDDDASDCDRGGDAQRPPDGGVPL